MLQHKYEHIIWDWNGTLLNDLWLGIEIANKMLENHGTKQLSTAAYQEAFGFPITGYYEKIGIDLEKESFETLTQNFVRMYNANVGRCMLHDGVLDLLKQFKSQGIQQHILTAAHLDLVNPLLDKFEIRPYFTHIEGVDNFRAEGKVQRGQALIANNHFPKDKTVLIGDTYHDFEVAQAMKIPCILIANGHQSKLRLIAKSSEVTKVYDRIEEVLNRPT